jgi:probable HAF family extracellular repeat protein
MKRFLLVAWGLLVGITGPAKAQYSYTTFDVPGATNTFAKGINDAGQVVGYFLSAFHSFLLDVDGSYTMFDVPGVAITIATGINDAGQVVGSYSAGGDHGFLLDVDGSYTTFDVPGAISTEAIGLNDAGQIVGSYQDASLASHGFLLDVDGGYTTLDVPGATNTFAEGINQAGQIVGGYTDAGGGGNHGFLLDVYGGFTFTALDVPGFWYRRICNQCLRPDRGLLRRRWRHPPRLPAGRGWRLHHARRARSESYRCLWDQRLRPDCRMVP